MNCCKKICLYLLCLSIFTAQKVACTDYSSSNTAIIFDVDGVILKRTVPVKALLWKHKAELAKALFNPSLIKEIAALFNMTAPVGAYLSLFKHKQPGLVPFARELITTRILMPRTVALIKQLLALGYELHIGTNETANEFILHQKRFPLFSRFSTYTFADYRSFPKVIQKPMPLYFEQMKNRILAYNKKTRKLIFIDDRKDNAQAAQDSGYSSIHFTSPEALEATLVNMEIIPPLKAISPLLATVVI